MKFNTVQFKNPDLFSQLYPRFNLKTTNNRPTILLLEGGEDVLVVLKEEEFNRIINPLEDFDRSLEKSINVVGKINFNLNEPVNDSVLEDLAKELDESLDKLIKKNGETLK